MARKQGRPPKEGARLDEIGIRVPVLFTPEQHAALKVACDGRPMAGVLRGLAAEFVAKVGGVG